MKQQQRLYGIILSYVQLVSNVVINLAYVPFLIGSLGQSEYGLYQLMGSLIAYFSVFDFGLSNSVIRFYSLAKANEDWKKQENILAISLMIYGGISFLCICVGGTIYVLIDVIFGKSLTAREIAEAKIIFIIQLVNIIISLIGKVFNAVVTSEERFVFLKISSLIQCYLQPIAIYCLVLKVPYATTIVVVQTVANVLLNIAVLIYALRILHAKIYLHCFDIELVKEMLQLSLSVFVVAITDQIFWKTNQFVLGAVLGTAEVAVYAVASQIYMNYMAVSSTIQGVFLPQITRMVATDRKNNITSAFILIGKTQFLLLSLILVAFLIIGKDFVTLWVGKEFEDSYWIALIIMIAMTIDLIQCIGATVLQAQNKYSIRAKVLVSCSVINLIFVSIMARFGGVVCASISAICMALANGPVMNFFYAKVAGLEIKKYWKCIGSMWKEMLIFLMLGICIGIVPVKTTWCCFVIKGIGIVASYILAMRSEIKPLLKRVWKRSSDID